MKKKFDAAIPGLVRGAKAIKNARQLETFLEVLQKHGSRRLMLKGQLKGNKGFRIFIVPGEVKGAEVMIRPKAAGAEALEFVSTTDPELFLAMGWKKFQPNS
jgi:hypothetical protein